MNKTCWQASETGTSGTQGMACRTSPICFSLHQQGESFSVGAFPGLCAGKEQHNYLSNALPRALVKALLPSPPSLPWKSASKDEAWKSSTFCLWHLGCCALTTCDTKGKSRGLLAEHSPNLCLQSYTERGKARGRLEQKKTRNWVMPKLIG